ncbi:glycosyltransferase [Glycomyces arizonensis]|uniref:glycosyltransferase n=1 Tax=Glycomyces arizonensis TaxID=256035 RepID=UPI00040AE915|nr:glycosyltransferase [Glycomyces arizonensis]
MTRSAMRRALRPLKETRTVATIAAAGAVAVAAYLLPTWVGLAGVGLIVATAAILAAGSAAALRPLLRDLDAKASTSELLERLASNSAVPAAAYIHRIERVRNALAGGFPDTALAEAKKIAASGKVPASERIALMKSVLDWHIAEDERWSSGGRRSHFDIVLISHFGLQGGNTSANVADIRAYRDHGLTVGLLHHPVFQWGPNAPMGQRIEALCDGETVTRIERHEDVTCDLAVVRLPTVLLKPLEERPRIEAKGTVVIANQTPFKFYGSDGPREVAWDIATVEAHVGEWLGPHTWYAGGPAVHSVLAEHHAEETAGLDLAFMPWNECIEIDQWRLEGRRETDGRIRIGRHSRDHKLKWPEDPKALLQCYPDREPFEIHTLGGADTPAAILGGLHSNWTTHPFNSLSAKEFLEQIDIMVYFISSDGMEAFGRAPLEAMAAGVPVIMDRRFEPTFGPAAVYCDPSEVASTAERLMSDSGAYAAQQSFAWDFIDERFSGKALAERLSLHGVTAGGRG